MSPSKAFKRTSSEADLSATAGTVLKKPRLSRIDRAFTLSPPRKGRYPVAAAVGIHPTTRSWVPLSATVAVEADRSSNHAGADEGEGSEEGGSYAPTIASWSTQSGYPSDCTRRLSVETRVSGASSPCASRDDDRSSQETLSQSLPGSPHTPNDSQETLTQSLPGSPRSPIGSQSQLSDTNRMLVADWLPAGWPLFVESIEHHSNMETWTFKPVPDKAYCDCTGRCSALTCKNALNNRFCTTTNCAFKAECGNALQESPHLHLSWSRRLGEFGITALSFIPSGQIIGQYFGRFMGLDEAPSRGNMDNSYRMLLETPASDGRSVVLDALWCGGKMRFLNHHCNPNCRFEEVQVGDYLTVVAVSRRDIQPGEEVTVSYGEQL